MQVFYEESQSDPIRQLKNRKYLVTILENADSNIEPRKRHQILSRRRGKYPVANLVKPAEVGLGCRRSLRAQGYKAKILEKLGVTLNRDKTRIVRIAHGFEFLGFKIQRGKAKFKLTRDRIKSKLNRQNLYAIPTQKSVDRFKDQIRNLTQRRVPLRLSDLIATINPVIRGWGNYFCRSRVRKRFHQLDGWIIRRLYSHRAKRWRNAAWKEYPINRLRTEFKLVSLVSLIPSLQIATAHS